MNQQFRIRRANKDGSFEWLSKIGMGELWQTWSYDWKDAMSFTDIMADQLCLRSDMKQFNTTIEPVAEFNIEWSMPDGSKQCGCGIYGSEDIAKDHAMRDVAEHIGPSTIFKVVPV